MNIRGFRVVPVTVSVITALVAGCGTASDGASSAAQPDPELANITVAALRVALAMLKFGFIGHQYVPQIEQGTLVATMVGPAS